MKIYIVSSGCVFEGGTNRHVALTEARAIELAQALVKVELVEFEMDEFEIWHVWDRNDTHPTVLDCDGSSRRVAFWRGGDDYVAVHEWEVAE